MFLLLPLLFSAMALARIGKPFDQETFDRLNSEGKPILVAVHADWCTTGMAQERVLASLVQRPGFKPLSLLRITSIPRRTRSGRFTSSTAAH